MPRMQDSKYGYGQEKREADRKKGRQAGWGGETHNENTWVSPGLAWSPCLALGD